MARNTHETAGDSTEQSAKPDRSARARAAVTVVRTRVAQVVWIVCVAAAVFLAAGALCIALKANPDNALVKFILQTADKLDLTGHTHEALTKNALVNWGLAAVVWLVAGRVLERVIRP
jgi:hypothetical protein